MLDLIVSVFSWMWSENKKQTEAQRARDLEEDQLYGEDWTPDPNAPVGTGGRRRPPTGAGTIDPVIIKDPERREVAPKNELSTQMLIGLAVLIFIIIAIFKKRK